MHNWIFIAVIGGVLSVFGLLFLLRRYRQDEITLLYLLAIVVGFISFIAFALVSAFRPAVANGPVSIAILLPAFVAILVVIRERRKTKGKELINE